ncbi:MAG: hypothetical protein ACI9KE_003358 [Polyangiales bacterium]
MKEEKAMNTKKRRKTKSKRQHRISYQSSFAPTEARIPQLAPWIAEGMPDDERAPARWRTSPSTAHRTQVCVLHLSELYSCFTTRCDEDELKFALAKIEHELGRHAVTFHYSAACSGWGAVMFTAQQPMVIAKALERHWGRVLRERHGYGEPFARELRWSLPSAPAEMEVLLGLTFLNRKREVDVAA